MDESFEDNEEWSPKYSAYEQECIDYIESLPEVESEPESDRLNYERKLWNYFQTSALAIAQLYSRENVHIPHNSWNSFQQASTNVACLYKECAEYNKKMYDTSHQNGYHKRTKEVLTWVKKKKNYIRREDLIAFLSGKNSNYVHSNCLYHHKISRNNRQSRNNDEIQRFLSSTPPNSKTNSRLIFNETINDSNTIVSNTLDNDEMKLETFNEALSMSGLRNSASSRRSPRSNVDDLREFINQEYHRHVESRKRTSSMDVCMDSPTHNKRTKFC